MRIDVKRFEYGSRHTVSNMYIDGVRECFVLEDKVRELDGVPVYSWKILGDTAIPKGSYKVGINFSNRFQKELPYLFDVPGFEGIRIHQGNTDKNTSGCLLLGTTWSGGDYIGSSQQAFLSFYYKLSQAVLAKQAIQLQIGDSVRDFVLPAQVSGVVASVASPKVS